jgi:hypothetical protein
MACLVGRDPFFLLENEGCHPWMSEKRLTGDRKSQDAAPDDDEVGRAGMPRRWAHRLRPLGAFD